MAGRRTPKRRTMERIAEALAKQGITTEIMEKGLTRVKNVI